MKKIFVAILCTFMLCSAHNKLSAQVWKDAFDKGISAFNQAEAIGKAKELTERDHKHRLKLYKTASDNFLIARENSRKMSAASTHFLATSLYNMSLEQSALGDDVAAFATIKRAIEYWPDLDVVPATKFINEQTVRVKGKRTTFDRLGDASDWQHSYFKSYVRATQLANILKKHDSAIEYADFILDEADTLHNESFIATAELSKAWKGKNDNCKAAQFAMEAIESALQYQTDGAKDKEMLSDYITEMAVNVSPSKECRFDPVKWEERAALSLARVHFIDDQSFYVLLYGKDAYNRGRKTPELLIALAEAEYYISKQPESVASDANNNSNWFGLVEENKKNFSSTDLQRLANLYALRGNKAEEQATLKAAKRKLFWESTHFGFSTNPANFYWGQYLLAFDLMLPKKTHELRVNYNTSSTHLFWKEPTDNTPGNQYFIFKGVELSYTMKFMERDSKGNKRKLIYSGPQVRFENRDYEPVNVHVKKTADHNAPGSPRTVKANSNRYEALMILGTQQRTKWLFIDSFFGLGGGWKTFKTDNIQSDETALDDRFRVGKWNKFYVPVHAGVRVGFIMK